MKKSTKELVLGSLTAEHEEATATLLHLKHQYQLPEKHRVSDLPEEEISQNIIFLVNRIEALDGAIMDINRIYAQTNTAPDIPAPKDGKE